MTENTVCVALRVRPLINSENNRGCQNIINVIREQNQVQIVNTDKAFTFNHVFDSSVEQEEFYNCAIKKMIDKLFKGYNVTILAYGQTGSGKTHSMGTNYTADGSMGVIPRAINDIFSNVESKRNEWSFKVTVSFLELYQEQAYDLLASDKQREDCIVDIREDNKGIKIVGITEKEINSTEATLQLLIQGSSNRATGATAMNHQSSRSHAIFTITIFQQQYNNPNSATTAKFHLVDLAGSERSKKTQATGERFKEGVNINLGLLALGNVISQLGESNNFVSYRGSKLTRLLQDSLGGNSITLMIACISPADYNLGETLSTLRYADRVKKIKNKPVINQDPKAAEINRLNMIINELRLQLCSNGAILTCPPEHAELKEINISLRNKFALLVEKFNANMIDVLCMNEQAEMIETAKEKIFIGLQKIITDLNKIIEDEDSLDSKQKKLFEDIRCQIVSLIDEQNQINLEIRLQVSHKETSEKVKSCSSVDNKKTENTELNDSGSFTDNICFDEHTEHTLRQAERNDQVQDINYALAIREKLINQILNNVSHPVEQMKEIQDMEDEIKKLQVEKEELSKALDNAQGHHSTAKLAETRRKKVQELEKKIIELNKKCAEQNRVLKHKQNSDKQVKNLSTEIQQLKQTRVKLIREMRKEAEKFNQYKMQKERDFYKLTNQDQKHQNELVKMKIQRNNQQTVFKRKLEEAHVVNKRLKEALEMQKKAQQRRDKNINSKEDLENWVIHELDVLHGLSEAECSVERIIKDRESIIAELKELNVQYSQNPTLDLEQQIKLWTDNLELRNVQRSDLQQKIVETKQVHKSNTRWQMIQSMGDARIALSTLFKASAENEKKFFNKYNDLMEKYDNVCMLKKQLEFKQLTYEKKNFANPSNNLFESEYVKKLEQELAEYKEKAQSHEKKPKLQKSNSLKRTHSSELYEYVDFGEDSILLVDEIDDIEKDPDWIESTEVKKARLTINDENNTSKEKKNSRTTKKRSVEENVKCACKTKCTTRLCSCRKNSEPCSSNCLCKSETCQNKSTEQLLYFDNTNLSKRYENTENLNPESNIIEQS